MGGLLALGVGLAVGAPPVVGQEVAVTGSPQGWLGIRYALDVPRAPDRPQAEPTMVILDVQDDSPARRAGVAPGDTVLRIDGRAVSGEALADLRALEPGQRVRLTLRREGRTVDADIVSGRRPVAVAPHVSVQIDSIRSAIVAHMDSARHSLAGGRITIVRGPEGETIVRSPHGDRTVEVRRRGTLVVPEVSDLTDPAETVPLELFLFHSQEADSLRREMTRLQRELQRVSQAEERRIRELAEEMARARREIDQNDARLRELREREARLQLEMARMRQEMERARVEARRQQTERVQRVTEQRRRMAEQSRRMAERSQRVAERARAAFRPLSLYAAGQNMLAGARLTDLNPALAEYFEVERGVLVTEVLEDTPAAQAPLVAGDVIVRVGETDVADLAGLRAALMRSSGGTGVTVVRKGRRVTVELPRE